MLIIKKKNVLHELAISLFLLMESEKSAAARANIKRIKERCDEALKAATIYTGVFGEGDLQHFLKSKYFRFNIDCGTDIVKGDIIRFIEGVFNNRRKPARLIGKRGITAEVMDIRMVDNNPILSMRVIASGGTWELKPETAITRPLKNVVHFEVMRIAWDDETQRKAPERRKEPEATLPPTETGAPERLPKDLSDAAKKVTAQMLGRYDNMKPRQAGT